MVVKVGTSSITENGIISKNRMSQLVSDIIAIMSLGYQVVIVTSGAISAGSGALEKRRENLTIPKKQAFASIGQTILMNEYRKLFLLDGFEVGQILLTEDAVNNRKRFLNVRYTINTLLELGVVPIVNENDSVAIDEIKFGDNDILSAHVANIVEADLLVLLSDIDGFYLNMDDPAPVEEICEINDEIIECAGGSRSIHGTGGMLSKIRAAEIVVRSGEMMIIANGLYENILCRIVSGEKIGTIFLSKDSSLSSRKRWIAFNSKVKGRVMIDEGAIKALCKRKKSLLSTGIKSLEGEFDSGDAVEIVDEKRDIIGKGLVNYNKDDLQKIIGKKSPEIRDILDGAFYDEVINRDDLILL
ncbi:MAG: glutamate 5-kinase [Spirochaetota bacterium]|nr:glutamate 5-kinase [Spirochaetota bacterium]